MRQMLAWVAVWSGLAALAVGCGNRRGVGALAESRVEPAVAAASARQILYRHARSTNGQVRSNAIETLGLMVGQEAGGLFVENLDHPAIGVQFAAAMAIGDCRYAPALPKLRALMAVDAIDQSLQCGAIYALHRLGDNTHTSRLADILYDGQPEARANAALVIGKMGLPAGVRPLGDRLGTEQNSGVKLQIAESLAALRHPQGYAFLKSRAWIGEQHEQLLSIQALGRSRSEQARGALLHAFEPGPDRSPPIRLAAAGGLGRMGDNRGAAIALLAVEDPEAFAEESFGKSVPLDDAQEGQYKTLAALALGDMSLPGAVDVLLGLLDDKDPTVSIAAAKAILNLTVPSDAPPAVAAPVVALPAAPAPTPTAPPIPTPGTAVPVLRTAPPRE